MSIVEDQVRRVDSLLDRMQLAPAKSATSSPLLTTTDAPLVGGVGSKIPTSLRITELQALIRALSTASSSRPLLSAWRISTLLEQAGLVDGDIDTKGETKSAYELELEWLLISKATVQTYGVILNTLLEQTIPLSDGIWYWDEILGSYTYSLLYTIQTSPIRFRDWTRDVYKDASQRFARLRDGPDDDIFSSNVRSTLAGRWKKFYSLVQESIRERTLADIQRRVLSPIALCRTEARRKQDGLNRLREMSASSLGVLMDEGLNFDIDEEGTAHTKARSGESYEWKVVVERSVVLMDNVLRNCTALEIGVSEFEDTVFASVVDDPEISSQSSGTASKPAKLSARLYQILNTHVPNQVISSNRLASEYGRPSRLIRYWLPATALLFSSTTILRLVVGRKEDIIAWIRDLGTTVQDFFENWVIDPIVRIIGTIRRDKDSEVAIMSKESLKGDRESLERMVVDFAIDRSEAAGLGKSPLSEVQIADIRNKVKEGDLTPILRAYESDLRRPFVGTVRGDLVRTLLIQVQKTKVDVEVAISGIDALLKSQELVFGFVGLTPGILICIGAFRYLGSMFGSRRGMRRGRKAGQAIRILRNIDRILTMSTPLQNGMLSYKDHGLLLCEIHVLRSRAKKLFPGEIEREFLEDVNELSDISLGVEKQLKVVERIRWAYNKWLAN